MKDGIRETMAVALLLMLMTACATNPGTLAQVEPAPASLPTVREMMAAGYPYGLDFDAKGRIWISFLDGFLVRMDDLSGAGLARFGSFGMGEWQFRCPMGIVCLKNGRVVVADQKNLRIVSFNGDTKSEWRIVDFSQGPDMTLGLRGLWLDASERIYVTDIGKQRILRMENDEGDGLARFGGSGKGESQFMEPTAVAIGRDGEILVNDDGNFRIVKFDDMQGSGWKEFGTKGKAEGQFMGPYGITRQPDGKILIADSHGGRIVRIDDMSGAGWTTFAPNGIANETLFFPIGIHCDEQGRIYFIDQVGKRLVRMDDMTGSGWAEFKF